MNNFFKILLLFLSINTFAGNLFNDNNNELISDDFNLFLINFEKRITSMKQSGVDTKFVKQEEVRLEAIIEHHNLNKENFLCYSGSKIVPIEKSSCKENKTHLETNTQIIFKEFNFFLN